MRVPRGRYTWRLTIDGQSDESWTLGFTTRPSNGPAESSDGPQGAQHIEPGG